MSTHDVDNLDHLEDQDDPEKPLIIKSLPDKYANTAPLGLLGFGLTTIMLSFHNVTLFGNNLAIVGMAIFYGGLAQFIAGTFEFKKGHTFTGTAFCSYGSFWWCLVTIWCFPTAFGVPAPDKNAMGTFLLFWSIFTIGMFVGTLKGHLTIKLIFSTLAVTLLLLSIGEYTEVKGVTIAGGAVGLVCGAIAVYTGTAEVIDGELGYSFIPV